MENKVVIEQRNSTLDLSLKSSSSRWWDTHKGTIYFGDEVKISIQHHFIPLSQINHLGKD
jgi:hypothetical protein